MIKYFETVSSTNDELKKDIISSNISKENVNIYITNSQTSGRGRMGHTFFSPSGGLYFSFSFKKEYADSFSKSNDSLYTIISCIAVIDVLKNYSQNLDLKIKWVNDIFLQEKKVGGILTEAIINNPDVTDNYIVIGIGLNLSSQNFPDEIKKIATSLNFQSKTCTKNFKKEIAINITKVFFRLLSQDKSIILKKYKSLLILKKKIIYNNNNNLIEVIAKDIDDNGNLVVQTITNETFSINSGEISFI